jgi:hypothetical protein
VELAKVGQPVQVFTKDVVDGLMRTDGTPVMAANTRVVQEGDAEKDPNRQAPDAPPSLRNGNEPISQDEDRQKTDTGVMRPVQPAKPHKDDAPWNNPDDQQPANSQPSGSQPAAQPAPVSGSPTAPASGTGAGGGQSSSSSNLVEPRPVQP